MDGGDSGTGTRTSKQWCGEIVKLLFKVNKTKTIKSPSRLSRLALPTRHYHLLSTYQDWPVMGRSTAGDCYDYVLRSPVLPLKSFVESVDGSWCCPVGHDAISNNAWFGGHGCHGTVMVLVPGIWYELTECWMHSMVTVGLNGPLVTGYRG